MNTFAQADSTPLEGKQESMSKLHIKKGMTRRANNYANQG